ncbi:hypothetical protein A4R35_03690 [Thermogemmatispora tikiterensis]|uniref:Uncharacterized protein n=1 Tax=Thermogemmatispora tikiterensis TaxID=1825093 RepID=A0A328VGA2_9CHLR|nr:hypothetical protein A4R35_03690 [Thermogemmatispora tikiterensis]
MATLHPRVCASARPPSCPRCRQRQAQPTESPAQDRPSASLPAAAPGDSSLPSAHPDEKMNVCHRKEP